MNPYEIAENFSLWREYVDSAMCHSPKEFYNEMTLEKKFRIMRERGLDVTWGRLAFTNNSNFAANFDEDCGLNDARDAVIASFPEAVEFDAVDCIWFYRDQESCDRDFDNADLNRGVVATWKQKEDN